MKATWKIMTTILLSVVIAIGAGCKKETSDNNGNNGSNNGNGNNNPTSEVNVTTYTPQDITATTAVCGGDAVVNQGLTLSEIGVCWSTSSNPTIEGSHKSTTNWNAPFVCTLTNLEPETTYYLRAFALRGLICYYGEEKSFTTLPGDGGGSGGDTGDVQNPEPSIAVFVGNQGYLYDGEIVDVNVEYPFAFKAASNAETQKDLATFKVYIDDQLQLDSVISGKEFEFTGTFSYEFRDNIIAETSIKAVVTDAAGKMNTATINLKINQPEPALTEVDFEWYRLGNTQTGLEEYGLYWYQNAKSPFAQIKPKDGVILYKFDSNVWNEVVYESQKAAKFADGATTIAMYNSVDVNLQNGIYDDVIGTRMADGTLHLIHVTSSRVGAQQSAGRPCYINGQAK